MEGMEAYPRAAVERAMKVQEVMLRAMARKITWYQAAEILGITDRHLRRWRERYEQFGFDGVLDRRRCRAGEKGGAGGTGGAAGRARSGCRWKRWSGCWACIGSSTSISTCGIFTRSWASSTASG